ncbi:MAG: FtsQ-type POTRA domain-containing protein [Acidimicrobiia bacterium]|nr:FtsQ-type POTRA domain-containing protein [Acidimicrobiia bacterium]
MSSVTDVTEGIDPRLARRRRLVQEASARRRLRWTVGLLVLAITAGVVVAVFQSSWFSIDSIRVEGAVRAPVHDLLADVGIEEGVSIVSVRAKGAEERLRSDPWVAEAQVRAVWPRSVEVTVIEHVPIARVAAGETWIISSGQGAVLAVAEPLADPMIDLDAGRLQPGDSISDPLVLGALEFVTALPLELKPGLEIGSPDGELEAIVGGYMVELGTPRDMAQKALTLAVLLEEGIPDGARVNLISPLRPAVTNPQPLVETSQDVATETTVSS